ncbi:CLUMA_CG018182, isoform A [Clunio marinus]|uniref:CLUMA_CG018182, isoform A n=1 Tax=Clunio marinus TaxID=568069 RepID=A0A1J1IYA9_9DIPT|nr:CLUMA_CG018182, isoform A [Clunio marinus]
MFLAPLKFSLFLEPCRFNGQWFEVQDILLGPFNGIGCEKYACYWGIFEKLDDVICDIPANASECTEVKVEGECCPKYENCPSESSKVLKCVPV